MSPPDPTRAAILDLLQRFGSEAVSFQGLEPEMKHWLHAMGFGLRSIAKHPSGPPWAMALPLVPWTLLLLVLVLTGRADILGFSRGALVGWAAFDVLLTAQLLRSAARPRPGPLACSAVPACVDAALSLRHLALKGLGATMARTALRGVATIAPCVGAAVLTWATAQAIARART